MRYAIVNPAGLVVNAIDYDTPPKTPIDGLDPDLVAMQSDRAGPGWLLRDGVLVDPNAPPSASLSQIKSGLHDLVERDAETIRLRVLTSGSGKAMSYQEKLAEARLILDDPANVSADLVPILAAEAQARGISLEAAATLVHTTYLAFKSIEAQINATSVLAKAAISSASDAAAAQAAYEAVQWPTIP